MSELKCSNDDVQEFVPGSDVDALAFILAAPDAPLNWIIDVLKIRLSENTLLGRVDQVHEGLFDRVDDVLEKMDISCYPTKFHGLKGVVQATSGFNEKRIYAFFPLENGNVRGVIHKLCEAGGNVEMVLPKPWPFLSEDDRNRIRNYTRVKPYQRLSSKTVDEILLNRHQIMR